VSTPILTLTGERASYVPDAAGSRTYVGLVIGRASALAGDSSSLRRTSELVVLCMGCI